MADDDNSISVLTEDSKAVTKRWHDFLADSQVASPVQVSAGGASSHLTCSSNPFWNLPFTSDGTATNFPQPSTLPLTDGSPVILGLDKSAVKTVRLLDVLDAFVGSNVTDQGLFSDVLDSVSQDRSISLHLSTDEPRNALWYLPGQVQSVSTALVFSLSSDSGILAKVKSTINTHFTIKLGDLAPLKLYCQRFVYGVKTIDGAGNTFFSVTSTYRLTVCATAAGFDVWLRLDPTGFNFTITQNPNDASDIWTKIADLCDSAPSSTVSKPSGLTILSHVDVLSFSIGKTFNGTFQWKIRTVLGWKPSSRTTNNVLIGLTYDSLSSTLSGELLVKSHFLNDISSPSWEPGSDVLPRVLAPTINDVPPSWNLSDLLDVGALPKAIPSEIASASMSYTMSDTDPVFSLSTTLTQPPPLTTDNFVPAPFTWDELIISASISSTSTLRAFSSFTLRPRDEDVLKYPPADLSLDIQYTSGSCQVAGYVGDLHLGLLFGFFDNDLNGPIADVVGKLTLKELHVMYTYSAKLASSFLLSGTITLGRLALRMFYQYISSSATDGQSAAQLGHQQGDPAVLPKPDTGSEWSFECYLGSSGGTANVGDIIDSIVDTSDAIPDFVKKIEIAPADDGDGVVSLHVRKTGSGDTGSAVFVLKISILGMKFSLLQVASKGKKRQVVRLSAAQIPLIKDIPLLNQLPQPFDQLLYMWVNPDAGDLLQADVDAINSVLLALDPSDSLLYKHTTKSDTKAAIQSGHHFIVINNGNVALDHVFGISQDESTPDNAKTSSNAGDKRKTNRETNSQSPSNTEATKGSLTKTLGPLSISAVALHYKDKVLSITMDATLALGPISLGLLGFSIGIPTTGLRLNKLSDLDPGLIQWALQGLSLSLNQPPLLIAGIFEHDIVPIANGGTENVYKGGVAVSSPPYTLVGVGEYATITTKDATYKSVFIFAKLDGPLLTLEFASILGVRLGFGFNSIVRSPTIDELSKFPFIHDTGYGGAGNDPRKILQSMEPEWITPTQNSYWFAAGMTVQAFDVLAVTAVAIFAFRDAGLIISIYADAIAQMPSGSTYESAIIYVEIGLVAELNFIDGYFRVEASLAPTSFLLVPACHLAGGFALVYWFGNNPHAGDFVLSIGGYHRAYTPPDYYPVPQRVSISFQIGDNMQITGQAYFAVTPKVVMGGALIHVSLSVGPIKAYLDASFDALINFHPLHYVVDFSVSIGVEFDIDVWFIHIHISASVGAQLEVYGPEFGGVAHVNFYLFGFDVYFGALPPLPPAQDLVQFWTTVHQPGPETAARPGNDSNPLKAFLEYHDIPAGEHEEPPTSNVDNAAFKFVLQNGNFPMPTKPTPPPAAGKSTPDNAQGSGKISPASKTSISTTANVPTPATSSTDDTNPDVPSTGAGAEWYVKGGTFQFSIATDFALSEAIVTGTADQGEGTITLTGDSGEEVYSKPMYIDQAISSKMTITIKHQVGLDKIVIGGWQEVALVKKQVPTAVWAQYNEATDPLRSRNPISLLNGKQPTRLLSMGVVLTAPKPLLAISHIPKFKASGAAKFSVLDPKTKGAWFLPPHDDFQTDFLADALTDVEKKETSDERWKATSDTWLGLDGTKDIVKEMLSIATKDVWGWDQKRPVSEQQPASTGKPLVKSSTDGKQQPPKPPVTPSKPSTSSPTTGRVQDKTEQSSLTPSTTVPAAASGAKDPVAGVAIPPWQLKGDLPKKLIGRLTEFYLALPRTTGG